MEKRYIRQLTEERNPASYAAMTSLFIWLFTYAITKQFSLQHLPSYFSILLIISYVLLLIFNSQKLYKWMLLIASVALLFSTKSFTAIYNDFAAYMGITKGIYLQQYDTATNGGQASFVLAILISLLMYKGVKNRYIYPYLILFIALLIEQIYMEEMIPYVLNCVLLIVLIGIFITAKLPYSKKLIISSLVGVSITSVILFGSYFIQQQHSSLHSKTANVFEELRYGKNTTDWKTSGNMNEVSKEASTSKTALTLVMEEPTAMYVKGFIGSVYADNQWSALSNSRYYHSQALLKELEVAHMNSETMLAENYEQTTKDKPHTVKVFPENTSKKYSYTPYELVTPIQVNGYERDGSQTDNSWSKSTSYEYKMMNDAYIMYPITAQKNRDKNYLKVEGHYNEFVYKNYLNIEQEEKKLLATHVEKENLHVASYDEAIKKVTSFLRKNMRYEKNTTAIKEQGNFVQVTLENTKQGYSPHYATLATLLFRQLGIPARYVEGYVVTKNLVENKKPYSEIKVTGKEAHAWPEIYIDQLGWVPVEVTPGYEKKMPKLQTPKGALKSVQSNAKNTVKNNQIAGEQAGEKQLVEDVDLPAEPTPKKQQNKWLPIVRTILLAILLIVLSSSLFIFYKRKTIRRMKKAMRSTNLSIQAKAKIALIEWQLENVLDIKKPTNSLYSWVDVLPKSYKKTMTNLIFEYQKIHYSEMVSMERLDAYSFKMQQAIKRPMSNWTKINYYLRGVL